MLVTILLAWLSSKYDIDPFALYLGTVCIDLAIVELLTLTVK